MLAPVRVAVCMLSLSAAHTFTPSGSVRRCSGRPRVDLVSLRIFFFFFNTLPFPTEYLWSAEYLCCSRVPLGYLCCFLFQQSTSGLQSTSVSAGSRQGYHCCFPHTHSHTLTHTLTRAHTPSRTRANTPTHTRSGSRDPKLGSRGSCLRLHRSGPLDRPVENAVPALARTATRQAPTSGPQLLNRS
jgi:hypothetical protein